MDPQHWQRLEQLFLRLEQLAPAAQQRLLNEECGDDPDLRRELEGMLRETALEQDWIAGSVRSALPRNLESIPDRLGRYRVVGEIGRGGLATVLEAERDDQEYRQRVAIKLIRRGLDTDDLLRRLRQERQILARLQHPSIAALIDGGSTPDGRPFVVMEYIEGRPIHEYSASLPLRRRLQLFVRVCEAVQYAHRNLVIHRDIKPANILVTLDGQPKLLDFGIAKLLRPGLHEPQNAAHTLPGSRWLTPEYASPEQLRGEPLTTATDVYSLGVLLFELLTGERPYSLYSGSRSEHEDAVCRLPVERPSSRIRNGETGRAEVGPEEENRPSARAVSGDLDNIVLMALRKEPERRYGSAEQLAEDVRRYLKDLPVSARPDRVGYRVGKFVLRHRLSVAIGVMSAILLLAISLIAVRQAQLANQQARRAEQQAQLAESKRLEAEQLQDFTLKIFEIADPGESRGNSITVREALERGGGQIQYELKGSPKVRAKLMETIGSVFTNLGLFEKARQQFAAAVALRRDQGEPMELAKSLDDLGEVLLEQGSLQEAERLFQEGLSLRRGRGEEALENATGYSNLGAVRFYQQRLDQAEEYWTRALGLRLRYLGRDHEDVAELYDNLGALRHKQGRNQEGTRYLEQALELRRRHNGPGHHETIRTESNLATLLVRSGDYERAEALYLRILESQERMLGKEHPQVATTLNFYSVLLISLGRFDEAEPLLRRAWDITRTALGADHLENTYSMIHLADGLAANARRLDEAAGLYSEVWNIRRRQLREHHPAQAVPLMSLGYLEQKRGRPAAAADAFEKALEIYRSVHGADHRTTKETAELWRRAKDSMAAESP